MDVADALYTRNSVRAFTPEQVPEAEVRAILDAARWAPSGGNVQPWRVIAVAGAERQAVTDLVRGVIQENPRGEVGDRPIYPHDLWEPHRSRRFKVGEDMYALLGIPREDKFARLANMARNYAFFDAPVGLFFVIDERMGHGQWAHLGMFMQSIALVAVEPPWSRLRPGPPAPSRRPSPCRRSSPIRQPCPPPTGARWIPRTPW